MLRRFYALWIVLLVPALLVAGDARASSTLRCEFSGMALAACCCPEARADADGTPVLARACCCAFEHADIDLPVGAPLALESWVPSTLAPVPRLSVPRASSAIATRARPRQRRLEAYARAGPSLVIVHRRLLL